MWRPPLHTPPHSWGMPGEHPKNRSIPESDPSLLLLKMSSAFSKVDIPKVHGVHAGSLSTKAQEFQAEGHPVHSHPVLYRAGAYLMEPNTSQVWWCTLAILPCRSRRWTAAHWGQSSQNYTGRLCLKNTETNKIPEMDQIWRPRAPHLKILKVLKALRRCIGRFLKADNIPHAHWAHARLSPETITVLEKNKALGTSYQLRKAVLEWFHSKRSPYQLE